MAVVLDTDALPATESAAALSRAMLSAGVPADTRPTQDGPVQAHMDLWQLDDAGTTLLRRRSTGVRLLHTAAQSDARVALALISPGAWGFEQAGEHHASRKRSARLVLVDHAAPYEFRRSDVGTTIAVNVDLDRLHLPRRTLAAAGRRLSPLHPLHDLLRDHLTTLAGSNPSAAVGSRATLSLVRALVAGASGDQGRARAAYHDSLLARMEHHVVMHLTDPGLTADSIAAAHHVSVRLVYRTWQSTGTTLSRSIIARRLELARTILRSPATDAMTIAEVARTCGFVDPTHFAHRFREAFDCSPRQWRADGGAPSLP